MHPRYLRLTIAIAVLLLVLLGATAALAQGGTVHVVRPGETLSAIARLYGFSPAAIADANSLLNPSLIFAGQRLTIPQAGPADGSTHVVRPGETLTSIARRYGVDPAQLAAANGLWDPNRIFVGQVLRIPASRPTPPAPAPRP